MHTEKPGILRIYWLLLTAIIVTLATSAFAADSPEQQLYEDYQLDSGDRIHVQIFNEDNLDREIVVNDRGIISFPFIGDVQVRKMTTADLEAFITEELSGDYLVNPRVFVDIVQYRSFYVNGEVQAPGGFPFEPGITVRKAISIAGGFKERASEEKIFVIREEQNESEPFPIDLDDRVVPGDIITVEQSFF